MDAERLLRTIPPLALLFVVADLPWLYFIGGWAAAHFKKVQGGIPMRVNFLAAVPVYVALAYLIQQATSTTSAFLIGLATYAVYDFTNLATLANYDLKFAIADSLWGGTLFAIVYTLARRFGLL